MDLLSAFVIPAMVGVLVGILSGLLGIGGGTVLVPVFRLLFSMSPVMSTATSLFTIIPTSVSGAISHVRHKTCIVSLGVAAGLGGALTSPFGVWLATISPGWLVMVVAALIIGWSAVSILRKALKMPPTPKGAAATATTPTAAATTSAQGAAASDASASGATTAARAAGAAATAVTPTAPASAAVADTALPAAPPKMTRRQLTIGVGIGLVAGVASGYVGVGGGFIMVPLMLSLVGIAMRQASGTSLIAVMLLAIPGVVEQGFLGNINYTAGIAVAIGSIPGAFVGARLITKVPERTLRFIFGGFLILAALLLVLNEFGILG